MSPRHLVVALGLAALAAAPAVSEEAQRRGGGGERSGAGARHHSGGSARSGGSSDQGSRGSGGVTLTDAQRRHPRAGTGTGYRDGRVVIWPRSHYYPYSRWGYYGYGYGYGYYPYAGYWSPYYWGGYYAPYGGRYRYYDRDFGSVRVLVDPAQTRVYVDGYYAGVADDFDGIFQRLNLAPGRHEITLKLDGYRTHRMRVYVAVDRTLKLHHDMVRGEGEDTVEDLAGGYEERAEAGRDAYERRDDPDPDADDVRGDDVRAEPGTLRLDIQPEDASVYVDGEFRGTARQARRFELPPGRHLVEIVRPGFRTVEREVEIEPGRTFDLDLDLERS